MSDSVRSDRLGPDSMSSKPMFPRIITTPAPGGEKSEKMSIPVRAHSFESAHCIWSRAAKHSKAGVSKPEGGLGFISCFSTKLTLDFNYVY